MSCAHLDISLIVFRALNVEYCVLTSTLVSLSFSSMTCFRMVNACLQASFKVIDWKHKIQIFIGWISGALFNINTVFPDTCICIGIPVWKIRWSGDHIILTMGILILGQRHVKMPPCILTHIAENYWVLTQAWPMEIMYRTLPHVPLYDNPPLTHWGPMTHICIGKLTIIGSDNGLSPDQRQAIIWSKAGILLIGPLGTNFSEILIEILSFSFKKMRLKISSAKWRPFVSASMR